MLRSILPTLLFLFLAMGTQAQAVLQIVQEPICWAAPSGADSSLTRYVLLSSRTPTTSSVLAYTNADGNIVVPTGGSFTPGWCDCCGAGGGTFGDNDWYFINAETIEAPIWRSGRVLIGNPNDLAADTSHQLQLEGDWQFLPDAFGTRFDWQDSADTTGTSWYGILFSAPAGLGGSSNLSGSRNNLTIATSNTVIDRTRLGVLAFGGNNPSDTDHALGAFIEAVADGAWSPTSLGTNMNIWTTTPGEAFPRNTFTFQGDGRFEMDRYFLFSDGVPEALLGYNATTRDATRHPIAGTPSPGSTIVVDGTGTGLEWGTGGGGGTTNFLVYNSLAEAQVAALSLPDSIFVEIRNDSTSIGNSRMRYLVISGGLVAGEIITPYVVNSDYTYYAGNDSVTVADIVLDTNGNNSNNGRSDNAPKLTLANALSAVASTPSGRVYVQPGTYAGTSSSSRGNTEIIGASPEFPQIYEGVVTTGWTLSSLSNVYRKSVAHTTPNQPNYNYLQVVEIDTEIEKYDRQLSRKFLRHFINSDSASVAATRGTFTFNNLVSPSTIWVHGSESNNINSSRFRYELVLSENQITFLGANNTVKNLHFIGSSDGYGPIDGGDEVNIESCLFEGTGTHAIVAESGRIANSLFFNGMNGINGIYAVYYSASGDELYGVFKNSTFMDSDQCVYSHTEGAKRYREILVDDCQFFGRGLIDVGVSSNNGYRIVVKNSYFENIIAIEYGSDTAYTYNNCFLRGSLGQSPFVPVINYVENNVIIDSRVFLAPKRFNNNVISSTLNITSHITSLSSGAQIKGNIFINRDTTPQDALSITSYSTPDSITRNVYIRANRDAIFRWNIPALALNTTNIATVQAAGIEQNSIVIDLSDYPNEIYDIFKDPDNGDFTLNTASRWYTTIKSRIKSEGINIPVRSRSLVGQAVSEMYTNGAVRSAYGSSVKMPRFSTINDIRLRSNSTAVNIRPNGNSFRNIVFGNTGTGADLLPLGKKSFMAVMPGNSIASGPATIDSSIVIGINNTAGGGTVRNSLLLDLNVGTVYQSNYMSIGNQFGILRELPGNAAYGSAYLFRDAPNRIFIGYTEGLHTSYINVPANTSIWGNRLITQYYLGGNSAISPNQSTFTGPSRRIENADSGFTPSTDFFRISGGRSTGTGNGSSLRLAVTLPGSSGTALNSYFDAMTILGSNANIGVRITAPSARLHLPAGTATAETAPLKLNSGVVLTTPEAGALEYDGTELYATNSTANRTILARVLKGFATLDFPNTTTGSSSDLTITVTGAADGDIISIGVVNALRSVAGTDYRAWVSSANTVTVRFLNTSGADIDPASNVFRVSVTK